MTSPQPDNKQSQKVKAGRDGAIVGRDSIHTTNINLWVSFFLIGVVALGGLAWAINVGLIGKSGNPNQAPQPSATSIEKPAKP
jgi:hypothetical protein